jgi:hypothetical protein
MIEFERAERLSLKAAPLARLLASTMIALCQRLLNQVNGSSGPSSLAR